MEINLKNDIVFKSFFSRKGNEKYLKSFLQALLNIQIYKIKVSEEVHVEKLFKEEKGGSLDLQVEINDEIIVNIEIMINILDYILYKKHREYVSKTAIVLDKHREHEVIKDLEWYFIELPKMTKINNIDMNNIVNQWLVFINNDRRYIKMAVEKSKILRDAKEEYNYLTGEAEERRLQDLRQRWEMDRISEISYASERSEKKGEKIGEKRGKKLGEQNIIKLLFKSNMSVEEIATRTGIKLSEILKIVD